MSDQTVYHSRPQLATLVSEHPVAPAIPSRIDRSSTQTSGSAEINIALQTTTEGPLKVLRQMLQEPDIQPAVSFTATARWEGVVTERFATYFSADVIDLDSGESASVEFDLDELSRADISLCEPGALFYWAIGYETRRTGQRLRVSVIQFRRRGKLDQE
jgi:hypothetical protein